MAVPECSLCGQAIAVSDVTPSPKVKNPDVRGHVAPGLPIVMPMKIGISIHFYKKLLTLFYRGYIFRFRIINKRWKYEK